MKSRRIEPLLRFREAREDDRRRDAARAEERLSAHDALIASMARRIDELVGAIADGTASGLDGAELRMREEHLAALQNQRLLAVAIRTELEREREAEHQRLLGAHRDRCAVENLMTRTVANEREERARDERAQVTELAVLGSLRDSALSPRSMS